MATEILAIPEERLKDVITVIRVGILLIENLKEYDVSDQTLRYLREWCVEEEAYLEKINA